MWKYKHNSKQVHRYGPYPWLSIVKRKWYSNHRMFSINIIRLWWVLKDWIRMIYDWKILSVKNWALVPYLGYYVIITQLLNAWRVFLKWQSEASPIGVHAMDGEAHSSVHDYVQNIGICTMLYIGWLSTFGACVNDNVLTPPCSVWVRSEEIHSRTNNVDCICYNQSSLGTCCPRNIFPVHFCQRQSYHTYLFAISRAGRFIVYDDVSI